MNQKVKFTRNFGNRTNQMIIYSFLHRRKTNSYIQKGETT